MKKYILSHPFVLTLSILAGVALKGLETYSRLINRDIVDAVVAGERSEFFSYSGIALSIVLLSWLFSLITFKLLNLYQSKSYRTISMHFFDGILGKKISDFSLSNSAKYISMLNLDMKTISSSFFSSVPKISTEILGLAMAVAAMGTISPINAVFALLTAPLPLVGPMIFGDKMSKEQIKVSNAGILFNSKVKDYLSGFETIKTFGVESYIKPKFHSAAAMYMRTKVAAGLAMTHSGAFTISALKVSTFINLFIAGYFVLQGNISMGELIAITGLSLSVLGPITIISNYMGMIRSTREIANRIMNIMDEKDTEIRDAEISALESNIEIKNLSFAYESAKTQNPTKPVALKNISYTFKKGCKYAIVGKSGSGKSTLAKLLLGYHDNYSGDILINNSNIRDINREGLYSVATSLQQNVFLLDDTLKNNITLYKSYSDEEYRGALTKASLIGLEKSLPNGSNTVLGEGGNTISGGERQRVSIARAVLKGCDVMIMDEATASLDNVTAHEIERSIVGMKDLTCIFVTHRYSSEILRQCDGILVIKDGELLEHGTFDEMYDAKGYFYSLYNVL